MPTWLTALLSNPAVQAALIRAFTFLLGTVFKSGTLPTGVDGLGENLGSILHVLAVAIPSSILTILTPAPPPAAPLAAVKAP